MKQSIITLIFISAYNIENYRLIFILNFVAKIYESILYNDLLQHKIILLVWTNAAAATIN